MLLLRLLQILAASILCGHVFAQGINNSIGDLYYFGGSFTSNNTANSTNMWSAFLSSRYGKNIQWKRSNYALGGGASIHLTPQRSSGVNALGEVYPAYFQNIDAGVVPAITAKDIHLTYVGPNDFVAFRVPYLNDHYLAYLNSKSDLFLGFGIDVNLITDPAAIRAALAVFLPPDVVEDILPAAVTGNPGNIPLDTLGPTLSQLMGVRIALINQHITELVARGARSNVVFTHHGITNNYHVSDWNKKLIESISSINSNVVIFDYFRFVKEVVSDENNIIPNDNPLNRNSVGDTVNGKFFPNILGSHPSPGAHQITANALASVLEATYFVPEITRMTLENGDMHLNQVLLNNSNNPKPIRRLSFGILGFSQFAKNVSAKDNQIGYGNPGKESGGVYADYGFTRKFSLGLQFATYRNELNMSDVKIFAKQQEYMFSLSPKISLTKIVQITGVLGVSMVKYEVDRKIPFGLQTRSESGNSSNNRMLGAVRVSFPLQLPQVSFVPYVDVSYQNTGKISYTEAGEVRSTRMHFIIGSRESLKAGIGAVISKMVKLGAMNVKPFMHVGVTRDFKGELDVTKRQAKVSDVDNVFHAFDVYSLPATNRNSGIVSVGMSLNKKIVNATIGYRASIQKDNTKHQLTLDFSVMVL